MLSYYLSGRAKENYGSASSQRSDVPAEVSMWHLALALESNGAVREKRPLFFFLKKKSFAERHCHLVRVHGVSGGTE